MFDVVALGELLIDFTPAGYSASGNVLFERNPGGAPANVLVALTMLGGKGAFIGKVGDDQFGHFLKGVLGERGIDTRGLRFSSEANTTLAFVHLDERGDRSFSFYRNPGADTLLRAEEVDFGLVDEARIFHFGSLSMTHEPARSATLAAVKYAKESGKIVSYDPNWRPPLWQDDAAAREGMSLGLKFADVLKLSEAELGFITGEPDLDRGSKKLLEMGISLVVVTLGPKGCYYRCPSGTGQLPTYDTRVVDTTGAGDAFMGALLFHISRMEYSLQELDRPEVERMLDFSNAAGALCASKKGGIPAMPTIDEVVSCMRNVPKLG
ncbi:MAG TPA: carbohydrate kinase [Firmicutes bacterium]|nr:carbohydrate kinase [Bacillota bacterium]